MPRLIHFICYGLFALICSEEQISLPITLLLAGLTLFASAILQTEKYEQGVEHGASLAKGNNHIHQYED